MAGGTPRYSQDLAHRRTVLSAFAREQFRKTTQTEALYYVVQKSAELVEGERHPDAVMVEDLRAVLIGDGLTSGEGRGRGAYFAGNYTGATGFRPDLRDRWNQVQHAVAGIVIGYRYGCVGEWYAMLREHEPQDRRLYEATFPLGRTLSECNYKQLAAKLLSAIAGNVCYPD